MTENRFRELSKDDQAEVLRLYYQTETPVKDIISAYDLRCQPGRLTKQFPLVETEDQCPYCQIPMLARQPSRTKLQERYRLHEPYCETCGHGKRNPCRCANCKAENLAAAAIHAEKIRLAIAEHFPQTFVENPLAQCRLRDAVYILAIARHNLDGDYLGLSPTNRQPLPLSPNTNLKNDIVYRLFCNRLIQVCPTTDHDAFIFDAEGKPGEFYPLRCKWRLLPKNSLESRRTFTNAIYEILADGSWPESWESEIDSIWNEIALNECLEHFAMLHEERSLEFDQNDIKTIDAIKRCLKHFSPAQTINLCWQSSRDAIDFMAKKTIRRANGQNVCRGILERKLDKYLQEGWNLRNSHRDRNCPRSALSIAFFDVVTGLGDDYFQAVPPAIHSEPP